MTHLRIPVRLGNGDVRLLPVGGDGVVDTRPAWCQTYPLVDVVDVAPPGERIDPRPSAEYLATIIGERDKAVEELSKVHERNRKLRKIIQEYRQEHAQFISRLDNVIAQSSNRLNIIERDT